LRVADRMAVSAEVNACPFEAGEHAADEGFEPG
jgi:hypothetical protein